MNKIVIWIAGAVITIAAVGAGVYLVVIKDGSGATSTQNVQTGDQAQAGATKTACDVYTLDIAKAILGDGARKSDLPSSAQTSSADVSVSNCSFEADQGQALLIANVLVRGAKNAGAYSTNEFGFNGNQNRSNFEGSGISYGPAEPISGLGDAAFYDPDFEQVNVLVNDGQYWIIAQADGGRAKAEQLAKAIVEKL